MGVHGRHELGERSPRARRAQGAADARAHRAQGWRWRCEEHLKQYGPGAGGVGWDLGLYGLERHLADPAGALDHEAVEAWTTSSEGKAFMRGSGEAWGAAHAASGEDPDEARAQAERTIAFYTGG